MSLLETTHSLMQKAIVYKFLWPEVINMFAYLSNKLPIRSNLCIIPEETHSWIKPNLNHLHIFGYKMFVHVLKQEKNKLQAKAHLEFLLGFMKSLKVTDVTFLRNAR